VGLRQEVQDSHFWRFTTNGKFSVKSAYEGFFCGSVKFEPFERVWRTWAPTKCRFFVWLVALNKCWTAHQLEKGDWNIRNAPFVTRKKKALITYCHRVCLQEISGSDFFSGFSSRGLHHNWRTDHLWIGNIG
jgi:hypothetical protein